MREGRGGEERKEVEQYTHWTKDWNECEGSGDEDSKEIRVEALGGEEREESYEAL